MSRSTRASSGRPHTVWIDGFLADAGFAGEAATDARRVLEEAGLTRSGKSGTASAKVERASAALESAFARVCVRAECRDRVQADDRRIVTVQREHCEVCGGSNNQAAVRTMVRACGQAGVRRIIVVGGTPNGWASLRRLTSGSSLELRFVDGTRPTNEGEALSTTARGPISSSEHRRR